MATPDDLTAMDRVPTQPSASGAAPAPDDRPARRNLFRSFTVARDVVLVVLGAMLALAADEWRESRERSERVRLTLAGIREEMRANSDRVKSARDHHRFTIDTLTRLQASGASPAPKIWSNGMWNPAQVTSTAWLVARETGVLADMPTPTVLELASVYEAQGIYESLGDALGVEIMNDVRRDGMETVLRDRFMQFIPLATDSYNREGRLLAKYEKALALPELK